MDCWKRKNILTLDQDEFLKAFFSVPTDFYLTGGTALAGFYLAHRTSVDLDFFTTSEEGFAHFDVMMDDVARKIPSEVQSVRTTHYFKHFEARMTGGALTIHAARDVAVRIKPIQECEGLRIDSIEDIVTNKLCAMLGRSAMKDFIDLYFLDAAGYTVEKYLAKAQLKDGGLAPETLAYSIEQLSIDRVPDYVVRPLELPELRHFKEKTVESLVNQSFDKSE